MSQPSFILQCCLVALSEVLQIMVVHFYNKDSNDSTTTTTLHHTVDSTTLPLIVGFVPLVWAQQYHFNTIHPTQDLQLSLMWTKYQIMFEQCL